MAVLAALCGLLQSQVVVASADVAWQRAVDARLWDRPAWLKLLHMQTDAGLSGRRIRSHAIDPDFFLAADGARDPRAEMRATLNALYAPAGAADEHAQCRFVARLAWLREALDMTGLPAPDCPAWREFRSLVQATQAVLVFPSYYLNSPSSMFGHTLLRLDPDDSGAGAEYLSFAVNFGAEVNPDDNGMFYAFKGLTGGYAGQFKIDHYYKKIQDYNRDENRDIWEYSLNLTAQETERVIRHVWELQGIDFAYYFFDENCSYRVLELLEVARPGVDLTGGFAYTAIPIDTVRSAQRAGLVDGKAFRPAKGTVLRHRLGAIPEDLHREVLAVAADPARLDAEPLASLDRTARARLIEAAYKYLRYAQIGRERDPGAARRSFALLRQLRAHADALPEPGPLADPERSPDTSHASRRAAAGLWTEEDHEYLTLGLRLSLHSQIENATGFLPGAQINLGNFELRVDEDGDADLQRLDVIDIFSLSPRDGFFQPLSWAILTGLERQWTGGREHRVAHVSGGAGASKALLPGGQLFGLVTARLEHNHGFADPLQPAAGVRGGWLQYRHGQAALLEIAGEKFANGKRRWRLGYSHNLRLARHHALHLEARYHGQRPRDTLAFGLRYQHYF